jgi:quinolinate synthase
VPDAVAEPATVALERMLAAKPPAAPAAAWEQAS